MSQPCAIENCPRPSQALCDCCQQKICLHHFNKHNAALVSKLKPLVHQIEALEDQFKTLNIETIIGTCREKLEQWRKDSYAKIDRLFEQKCEELNKFVNDNVDQQRKELEETQAKITELIDFQETTSRDNDLLMSAIRQLETRLKDIEQTYYAIYTRPLNIDDSLIYIRKIPEHEFDNLTLSSVEKTMDHSNGSFNSLASNDQYLLIHQHPNLCLLDSHMNIVKQTAWEHGTIWDMCWSSALNQFIVLGESSIFLLDESTMLVENIYTIEQSKWLACTCSATILYACTNCYDPSIVEFSLVPKIERTKEWKTPVICTSDERILDNIYNNGHLGTLVKNGPEKSLRIELRYAKTFDKIWSLQINNNVTTNIVFRCCSLPCNEWLVCDHEKKSLIQITKDGKIKYTKNCQQVPYCAVLFGQNKLVVTYTNCITLHKVQ